MRTEVLPDAESLARRAAQWLEEHDPATIALSGGRTPQRMLELVSGLVAVYQADERVAPDGDDARNWTHIRGALGRRMDRAYPMPVTDADLDAAALRYASVLPPAFDVVHLGLGADGHTASLVPGDAVLRVTDRDVATTGTYEGHRRMTLTYPAINRARRILWVVTGDDKADALRKLLSGDESIPAGRVRREDATVLTDVAY